MSYSFVGQKSKMGLTESNQGLVCTVILLELSGENSFPFLSLWPPSIFKTKMAAGVFLRLRHSGIDIPVSLFPV